MKDLYEIQQRRLAARKRTRLALLLSLLSLYLTTAAQNVARALPAGFNNLTGYFEHLPPDYNSNPNKKYPLLIFVHGVGELAGANATVLDRKVLRNGPPRVIEQGKFPASFTVNGQQHSFIVITPQFKVWPGSSDVHRLVNYLKTQRRIDDDRLYVTGLSMGGGVIWGAISEDQSKAKQYAAAAIICGAWSPDQRLANVIAEDNTPVWALHNRKDPTVPSSYSEGWVKNINSHKPAPNPKARLTMFDRGGHDAWSTSYDPAYRENGMNVYEWMLQYSKGAVTTPPPPAPPAGNRRITVPPNQARQIYYPDVMKTLNVRPGDTLCLAAGDYDYVYFSKLQGTADKPIVIMNCGGLVRVGVNSTSSNGAFVLSQSKHFKIEGTGDPNIEYGFDVNGTNARGQIMFGFFLGDGCTDYDMHHIYIHDCGTFVQAKTIQTCNRPEWLEGAFVMRNVKYHHLKCRNSAWEGFYIGNTHYLWSDGSCKDLKSHHVENLEVYDNDLENMGSDGIQISMADLGTNLVHHNRVVNYGTSKNAAHGYGILSGGGSTLRIYNNRVDKGYNCGVQIFGSGINYVYNNVISNIEYEGINVTDKLVFQPATGYIYNNTVYNTDVNAMKIYADLTTVGHKIYNNLVVAKGTKFDYPQEGFYIRGSHPIKFDTAGNLSFKNVNQAAFEDGNSGNVRLTDRSAAVNRGRDMKDLSLDKDMDDHDRPYDNKYDVGAYEFEGTATGNLAPTANAGTDQSFTLPISLVVQLDGSMSKDQDGKIRSYSWRKKSGPVLGTILTPDAVKTTIAALVQGTYVFELTVTDDQGATGTDEVTINVNQPANTPPVANAGSDITIAAPASSVQLNGGNSKDDDGSISHYAWKKLSGPAGETINAPNSSRTDVTGLKPGTYIFELAITDDKGASASDQVKVNVLPPKNDPPLAKAGTDITLTLPSSSAQLDGSASSDVDGSISQYSWVKVSGPAGGAINARNSAKTSISGLIAGTYEFELTVTDDDNAKASDRVTVTVHPANKPPVARAGSDKSITLPVSSVHLDGSASSDEDGTITDYTWTRVSGPAATISSPDASQTDITGLTAGTYVFELTVTDNDNATATGTVTVTVHAANKRPVADAGNSISITLPVNSAQLDGSGSDDPDGNITSYSWTKVSGPAGGAISASGSAKTNVTNLAAGTYVFELTVKDDDNATDADRVTVVVVQPAANKPPVAEAGNDLTITLPVSTVRLDGSASSDADGNIRSYAWTRISGPAATIASARSAQTDVTGLSAGTYVFELTVTDNDNAETTDRVRVVVNPPANKAPIARAGNDITITLHVNSVQLDGRGSADPDGAISAYAWKKISGPTGGAIASAAASVTNITGLTPGAYVFQLTVTDEDNATASDRVTVTVQPAANKPPVADAGNDITITLPLSTVHLDGSASADADGNIRAYAWTRISGPAANIASAGSAQTDVTGLSAGTYVFELTVTDDDNAETTDRVRVVVNPPANKAPIARAGNDLNVSLPVNSVQLDGRGSDDPDGSISAYAWKKISGPAGGAIGSPAASVTAITGLTAGAYVFELTVKDNDNATAADRVTVTVAPPPPNTPPVADAGDDIVITLPTSSVQLNGSGSDDPDGAITAYAWKQVSGPGSASIGSPNAGTTGVSGLVQGAYVFELTVTDNRNGAATDRITVTVNRQPNKAPVADAGTDQVITLPANTVQLSGSASHDTDGSISGYAWTKISGPAGGTLSHPAGSVTNVSGLQAGTYEYQLTVTDNDKATASDRVIITVRPQVVINKPPVAVTSADLSIQLPVSSVYVNGRTSSDPDGVIEKYEWKQVSGPSQAAIAHAGWVETQISSLKAGIYEFELKVTDNDGATGADRITVTVLAIPGNQEPIAVTQGNQVIQAPTDYLFVNGRDSYDPDGTVTTYTWKQLSGPDAAFIWHPDWAETRVSGLRPGQYKFELKVTDNKQASNTTTFTVDVLADKTARPTDSVSIWPNPAISFLRAAVKYLGTGEKLYFSVYDMSGRRQALFTHPLTSQTLQKDLDISQLPAGYYMMEIRDEKNEFRWVGKFLKAGN